VKKILPRRIGNDKLVGCFSHGTDNDNDLISGLCGTDGFSGGTENLLRIGNAGPSEFLNNKGHKKIFR
jgi:hypothetical protein